MNDRSTWNSKTSNQMGEAKDAVAEVKDKVLEAKDKVLAVGDSMADRGMATADKIRAYAKANPFKAIAIAFAIGYFGMRVTRPLRWL